MIIVMYTVAMRTLTMTTTWSDITQDQALLSMHMPSMTQSREAKSRGSVAVRKYGDSRRQRPDNDFSLLHSSIIKW